MSVYKCVYFVTNSGRIPAEEFVDSLHNRTQQKFFEVVWLLQNYGKSLPKPHSDFLGDEIYELRFTGIEGNVRILYFFYYEHRIVFTNGFIKKQQKAPRGEVELAKERRKLYIQNHKR